MSARESLGPVVLVVEDEPIIRMVATFLIEDAGFQAIEAASADAALRILEERADIRIVFTDINMPGSMDGLELAIWVRHRWPPIGIIITSAHFIVEDRPLPARCHFLNKPYAENQLLGALRDLTD